MRKEDIINSYLKEGYNCAETILRLANEEYKLGVGDGDIKLISGFGGGMGAGSLCGALTSSIAVLGKMFVETKDHDTEGFREICGEFFEKFKRELGSTDCDKLKATYKKDDATKCLTILEKTALVLEEFLIEKGKIARKEEKVTISPEDITRVKALGFLHNKGTNKFNARVITRNGKITAAEQICVAEAAAKYGDGHIAMTTRLTMEVTGVDYENIEPFREYIAKAGLETGGTGSKVRPIVSCKGTTCQYGLYDTYALSEKIHEMFYKGYRDVKLPHKFKIATGGCPNNCVKPGLNDLGIVGQRVPKIDMDICRGCKKCAVETNCPIKIAKVEEGKLSIPNDLCNHCGRCIGKCPFGAVTEDFCGYKVVIGGRFGKKVSYGKELDKIFKTEEEVLAVVEKTILFFREQGVTGERLADTVERVGFDKVSEILLGDEILDRKDAIINAEMHLKGGATC